MRRHSLRRYRLLRIIIHALFLHILLPPLWAENSTELYPVHLDWTEDESVLRYEVIIENEEEDLEVLREYTAAFSITVSLPPGNYRCKVIPYDFLEKPGNESPWMSFVVLAPKIPEPIITPAPEPEPPPVLASPPPAAIKAPIPLDVYINAAWMPLLPIYGEEDQFFGRNPLLPGAGIRLGALLTSLSVINPGLEAAGSWYLFRENGVSLNVFTAGINLVAQKRPRGSIIAITIRAGAGYSIVKDKQVLNSNIGASIACFPTNHFSFETGIDHVHLFKEDLSGCLRPWLGIGLWF